MDGRPVWLASISYRSNSNIVGTKDWGDSLLAKARLRGERVLRGIGEESMERGFLMSVTMCIHRAATDAEIAAIPEGKGGLAGAPFSDVVYETDACPPAGLSFTPCDSRWLKPLGDFYLPMDDCGNCPSCHARERL